MQKDSCVVVLQQYDFSRSEKPYFTLLAGLASHLGVQDFLVNRKQPVFLPPRSPCANSLISAEFSLLAYDRSSLAG